MEILNALVFYCTAIMSQLPLITISTHFTKFFTNKIENRYKQPQEELNQSQAQLKQQNSKLKIQWTSFGFQANNRNEKFHKHVLIYSDRRLSILCIRNPNATKIQHYIE